MPLTEEGGGTFVLKGLLMIGKGKGWRALSL